MVVSRNGDLKVYLHELERYHDAIPDSAALVVHIFNKNRKQIKRFSLTQYLDEPLVSEGTYGCRDNWYFYGAGPFTYTRTTGHPTASEGVVNSLQRQRKNSDGQWELFSLRDKNYDAPSRLPISWLPPETTENLRRPDPAISRSFMDFNFSIPPYVNVVNATLTVEQNYSLPETHPLYLEPDKSIYIHKVSDEWDSRLLTWNNQPGVTGNPLKIKKSSRHNIYDVYLWYDIDVTALAEDWVGHPDKYHGLRFSLKGWDGKDRITFISGNNHVYERPVISIDFTNPRWSRENSIIPVGSVSKGDTVRFTYDNLGPPQDYSNVTGPISYRQFDGIERVIDTAEVKEGYALSFLNTHKSSLCESEWLPTEFMGAFAFIEGNATDKIMLGATKYYAALWKDPAKKEHITIEEVETDGNGEPIEPSGLIGNAFENNPIEVMAGGKSGVYWERKWATVNNDGSISSAPLPSGMIRVVGRYWEQGKDYKVKLKAEAAGGNGEMEIEVVKPNQLGNKYGKARDVFDEVVDMDSVIIANAGKYGIPPQWIKGQMQKETDPIGFNFPEGSEEGFAPAYRYEPFNWEFIMRDIEDINSNPYEDNPFWVTENSMGVDIPPAHKNIIYKPYPKEPLTVWDMVNKNSHITNNNNFAIYGKHLSSGKMDFEVYEYSNIQQIYDEIKNTLRENYSGDTLYTKARDSIAIFLKTKWKGPEERQLANFEGGLENLYAQTRIASSYGLIQMMYHNATKKGYDIKNNNAPEYLNEVGTFFPFAMDLHLENLGKVIDKPNITDSNWAEGFEQVLMRLFNKWNSYRDSYEQDIAKFSLEFKPEDSK